MVALEHVWRLRTSAGLKLLIRADAFKREGGDVVKAENVMDFNRSSRISVAKSVLKKGCSMKCSCGLTVRGSSERPQGSRAVHEI